MTIASGFTGAEEIMGETQFYVKTSSDVKEASELGTQEAAPSSDGGAINENPEPITTRWELWSWYAFAFGNNSAGTLSYAPLSMAL
jgi:hypothetical protein